MDDPEEGNEVSYPFLQNNTQGPAPGLQTRYGGGDGDAEPYELTDWGELDSVRANLGANFTLAADIDELTAGYDSVASETANGGDSFEPIGDSDDGFEGSFDGNGNIISDLQINRSGEEQVGLFGRTSGAATVENVHLKNATVRGESAVGGLVGRVTDGTIIHVSATVDVEGSGSRVGGLVGGNSDGEISKSHATGNVIGDSDVGGLVGTNSGEVSKSHATGEVEASDGVVGGLAGSNTINGEISESYTTSDVESSGGRVGGLVGDNRGEILNSYWDIETTGQDPSAGDGEGLTTDQMTGANASADGNMDGFDFENTWYLTVAYPSLSPPFEGEGTEAEPYELKNVLHLQEMRKDLSANYRLVADIDASETTQWNVDGGEAQGFDPIGEDGDEFTGSFDGSDNTISNLTIDRSGESYVGLFERTTETALVEGLSLVDVDITANSRVGALVGENHGTISNVYTSGTVNAANSRVGGLAGVLDGTASDVESSATVTSSSNYIGGITGKVEGELHDARATGDVSGRIDVGGIAGDSVGIISNSSATGTVVGSGRRVGGLVGDNFQNANIMNSFATGNVTGSSDVGGLVGSNDAEISNTSASGTVNGDDEVGGLVGQNSDQIATSFATGYVNDTGSGIGGLVGSDSGSVDNSYWDTESTNQSDSAGGTGLTTAQMTGLNATEPENMGALDFATSWTATDSYPLLQWSVAELALDLADDELTVGETTTATVTLITVDGRAVGATTTSDYTSSDSSVASVDRGTVTAEQVGSTVIKATQIGIDDEASLSVRRVSPGGGSGGSSGGGSPTAEEGDDQDESDVEELVDEEAGDESVDDIDTETTEPIEADETDDDTPGFGAVVGIVSLLAVALLLRRRSSRNH